MQAMSVFQCLIRFLFRITRFHSATYFLPIASGIDLQRVTLSLALGETTPWLWHGKEVKRVDGFTFTLPDRPENQAVFPQLTLQKPGVGFPIARACAVLSLANACIHDPSETPLPASENIKPHDSKKARSSRLKQPLSLTTNSHPE